ncbi:MAG: sugar phosphate isomerase/epimerase [Clostridia bacterium]|nr:sugar phosphate isomerase/epimerase [Clostridia bacterium]
MNIGIRLHDTLPGSLSQRLAYAKAQGFSCAHLALQKALDDFAMADAPKKLTKDFAEEVKQAFRAQGMECAVLGCYLNLADPDAESRARTQEIYRSHLRFARMMGVRVVGTETPANPASVFSSPARESEDAFRLVMDSLKTVARFAEEEDAILAVEPVYTHIVSTPERAERMLSQLHSDHVKIILDAVNLLAPENVEHADDVIAEAIRRFGDQVMILHMKDYELLPGKIRSIACGTGVMHYDRLLSFGKRRDLPMTLEDTRPDNAEAARLYLEKIGERL